MPVCSTFVPVVRRQKPAGFGLIELMITISILAILAAIALPSYRQTIQNNRTTTEANDFMTAIDVARGEATSRTRPVTLCPANAAGTACTNSTAWGSPNRWLVFTDYGTRGQVDAADVILRIWNPPSDQDAVTFASAAPVKWISFDRAGVATTDNSIANGSITGIQFKFRPISCSATANVQRTVTVQPKGRASVATGICT